MRLYITTKRKFVEQIEASKTEQYNKITSISLSRARISIRYLAHLLENGQVDIKILKTAF